MIDSLPGFDGLIYSWPSREGQNPCVNTIMHVYSNNVSS